MSGANLPKLVEEFRARPIAPFVSSLVEASPTSSLSSIIGILREQGVYEIFLPERERCGIIAARDVLKASNIESTKPSALMHYVPFLGGTRSIAEAARIMADYRIRAVPISDGRKIVGQVNSVGLLSELKGKIGDSLRISYIATKDPITIESDSSAAKARELMIRKRIDHLPLIHDGRLVGMLTSNQVVSRMAPAERVGSKAMKPEVRGIFDFEVADVMERSPLTCSPDTSADRALSSMLDTSRTYVLVSQWDELQAIATHRDFMKLLAELEPEPEVPIFMVGLPEDPFEAEAAKVKFKRTVNQLHRMAPDILEARSIIKAKFSKPGKERGRYEVAVHIRTPRNSYSYSEGGWDLPAVYDIITDRLKRLLTQKQKPRKRRERERPQGI